jgi:hypothetical protein
MIQNKDDLAKIITAESVSSGSWFITLRRGPRVFRLKLGKASGFHWYSSVAKEYVILCLMIRFQVIILSSSHTC